MKRDVPVTLSRTLTVPKGNPRLHFTVELVQQPTGWEYESAVWHFRVFSSFDAGTDI